MLGLAGDCISSQPENIILAATNTANISIQQEEAIKIHEGKIVMVSIQLQNQQIREYSTIIKTIIAT